MSQQQKKRPSGATKLEWPTSGRILRYTYAPEDFAKAGTVSRPCIVVDTRESERGPDDPLGEVYDVVVFTAGLQDFDRGREGWVGYLSKTGLRLTAEPMPGSISWPPMK